MHEMHETFIGMKRHQEGLPGGSSEEVRLRRFVSGGSSEARSSEGGCHREVVRGRQQQGEGGGVSDKN